jgi:hypothetical protein
VRWLGRRRLDCRRHPRPWDVLPVRIRQDAFVPGQPRRDLVLSPDHAVLVAGALIPVRYLVNGATIVQEDAGTVEYWHVELDRHDVLLAEGLPSESYLDTGNRADFENGGAPLTLHPDFAARGPAETCQPLVLGGPGLADARARLLRRALRLGWTLTDAPGLVAEAGGRAIRPQRAGAESHVFELPPVAAIRLRSRAAVPGQVRVADPDHRRLGVAVCRLMLDGREVGLDDPRLGAGWHGCEDALRWTDGDAVLATRGARRLSVRLRPLQRYWMPPGGARLAAVS